MTIKKQKTQKPDISFDDFAVIYDDITLYPSILDVAIKLGMSQRTVRDKASKFRLDGKTLADRTQRAVPPIPKTLEEVNRDQNFKLIEAQNQISQLRKDLRAAEQHVVTSRALKQIIYNVDQVTPDKTPAWLTSTKIKKSLTGIPVLFLSDIHFDEVVDKAQVGGINEFNRDVATARIKHTFNTAIELTHNYLAAPNYEGIVVAMGGDMLSGNIHEELSENNEGPILESVVKISELLIEGIRGLADVFGKVFVPCVVGNHGRLHKKPRAKNRVFDNFEWIMYHIIRKEFLSDARVTVHIPDSPDTLFQIYNRRFLLTHGDQFKGGSGIAGIFSPLMLGNHRKQKRNQAVGAPYDILMVGHFHQYIHSNSLIVNGSIKGYDEYAFINNLGAEDPQQALFIVHPEHDITFRMPVQCGGYETTTNNTKKDKLAVIW